MSKVPQKLDRKKSEIYKNAPISKFGERKPDYSTMGRAIKNPHKNSARSSAWKPAGHPTDVPVAR